MARYEASRFEFCTRDGARLKPLTTLGQRWEGRTLAGRYKVGRFLGAGGMAEVYRAEDQEGGPSVALKLIRPQALTDASALERFKREAQLVALIDHPNVVKVYGHGPLEEGVWYMALELLQGRTLEETLEDGELEPPFAMELAIQIALGLEAAHEKQIIHRDLKPANVFLHREGDGAFRVKLLDLGIAKLLGQAESNLTATGMIFGTPEYMSPEQALGKELDLRADLYSLGVLLYRLFVGALPFQAESFVGVLTKQVTEQPRWPTERAAQLPKALAELVMKALAKAPGQRQRSVRDLRLGLEKLRRKLGPPVVPRAVSGQPSPPARPPRPTIKRVRLAEAGSSSLDQEAVEIAPGIFWVGRREGVSLERNTFLCTYRGHDAGINVLIDPGPPKDLATVSAKVGAVIGALDKVDLLFLNHQDPDVAANAAVVQELNPRAHVWCSEDAWRLLHFYGLRPGGFSAVEQFRDRATTLVTGHRVSFVPTPYCHFRGAVMYYDETSRVLFSGDLFGGLSQSRGLASSDDAWAGVEIFHQLYMPSSEALRRAVQAVWRLDPLPLIIAPQHGSLVQGDQIPIMLERVEALEVGLDLLRDEGDEASYLEAVNELIALLSALLGPDETERELRAFSADGSFPDLFVFEGPLQVAAIKIQPCAALAALLGSVSRSLDEPRLATLREGVARIASRHGLRLEARWR